MGKLQMKSFIAICLIALAVASVAETEVAGKLEKM